MAVKLVYVDLSIFNQEGKAVMAIGGKFRYDGAKLLPDENNRTWRDLFAKVFLSPPLVQHQPDVETATGKTIIFTPKDLYKEGKPPPETYRRYGKNFRVKVICKNIDE